MMKSKLIQIAVLAAAVPVMSAGQQNTNPASQQTNTNGAAKKSGSTDSAKKPVPGNPASGTPAPGGKKGPVVNVDQHGSAKTMPAPVTPAKPAVPGKNPPVVNQMAKQAAAAQKGTVSKGSTIGGGKTSVTKSTPVQTPKPTAMPVSKNPSASPVRASAEPQEGPRGRRDPFVSVIKTQEGGTSGPILPPCSTGKKCLFIPQIVLQGTVRDRDGKMIALVANGPRTYFLRENDQVFNGSVIKITTDSVIFRESITDKLGHESSHEVVKRLTPAT